MRVLKEKYVHFVDISKFKYITCVIPAYLHSHATLMPGMTYADYREFNSVNQGTMCCWLISIRMPARKKC